MLGRPKPKSIALRVTKVPYYDLRDNRRSDTQVRSLDYPHVPVKGDEMTANDSNRKNVEQVGKPAPRAGLDKNAAAFLE